MDNAKNITEIAHEPVPTAVDPRDAYFDTTHLDKHLRKQTMRGGIVTLSSQAAKFVLRLVSTAVMARLLKPADFGLVAMVTVITGFVDMFKEAGLSMATVQREKITHAQVSTLFWLNVALGTLVMLLVVALAPVIAWFYHEPRLICIALVLSGTMLIGALGIQHQALLRRKMQFTRIAVIDIATMSIGTIVGIVLAEYGFGYWSLLGVSIVQSLAGTAMVICASGWVPTAPKTGSGVGEMVRFGSSLTGFNVINYFARQGDNLLIGRFLGSVELGLYSKAYGLLMMPIQQVNAPIGNVMVPALCRLTNDPQRFRRAYLKVLRYIAWVTLPGIALASIFSDSVMLVVLGPQWIVAAETFRILAIPAAIGVLCNTTGWLYISNGRAAQMMYWGMFSSLAIVCSFVVGLPWGVRGVATAYAICVVLIAIPCFYFAIRTLPISLRDIAYACAPGTCTAALICFVYYVYSGYNTF